MAVINSLYLLTDMTGRASGSERTMIVATMEMKMRTFWIALAAAVPGLILTALFYPMVGIWALAWLALSEGAAFFLIEKRTADGLRLRTYQTLLDKAYTEGWIDVYETPNKTTGAYSSGRCSSIRARVRRSSTSWPILLASLSMRPMAAPISSGFCRAPWRYSSEKPRMVTSGVRSSCEASWTKRRIFCSDLVRAANAVSMWASMAFRDRDRRPTSVDGLPTSTRRDRSPAAMAAAVFSTWLSGRN